jgi:hypothetical protein
MFPLMIDGKVVMHKELENGMVVPANSQLDISGFYEWDEVNDKNGNFWRVVFDYDLGESKSEVRENFKIVAILPVDSKDNYILADQADQQLIEYFRKHILEYIFSNDYWYQNPDDPFDRDMYVPGYINKINKAH